MSRRPSELPTSRAPRSSAPPMRSLLLSHASALNAAQRGDVSTLALLSAVCAALPKEQRRDVSPILAVSPVVRYTYARQPPPTWHNIAPLPDANATLLTVPLVKEVFNVSLNLVEAHWSVFVSAFMKGRMMVNDELGTARLFAPKFGRGHSPDSAARAVTGADLVKIVRRLHAGPWSGFSNTFVARSVVREKDTETIFSWTIMMTSDDPGIPVPDVTMEVASSTANDAEVGAAVAAAIGPALEVGRLSLSCPTHDIVTPPRVVVNDAKIGVLDLGGVPRLSNIENILSLFHGTNSISIVTFGDPTNPSPLVGNNAVKAVADLYTLHSIKVTSLNFSGMKALKSIGNRAFQCNTTMRDFRMIGAPLLSQMGSQFFMQSSTITVICLHNLPSLRHIGNNFACECPNLGLVSLSNMPKLNAIGREFCARSGVQGVALNNLPVLETIGALFASECSQLIRIRLDGLPALVATPPMFLSNSLFELSSATSELTEATADVLIKNCTGLTSIAEGFCERTRGGLRVLFAGEFNQLVDVHPSACFPPRSDVTALPAPVVNYLAANNRIGTQSAVPPSQPSMKR